MLIFSKTSMFLRAGGSAWELKIDTTKIRKTTISKETAREEMKSRDTFGNTKANNQTFKILKGAPEEPRGSI